MAEELKRFIIIAGPNGCGKTLLYERLKLKNAFDLGVRINPDEIAASEGVSDRQAGRIAVKLINACIDAGKTFNQETTLSGVGFEKHVKDAAEKGFEVQMYYVIVTPPEEAFRRANDGLLVKKDRTQAVSEETAKIRYVKSQKNFPAIFKHCAHVEVFDNTGMLEHRFSQQI
jgi:predicted ABC-type ATPase